MIAALAVVAEINADKTRLMIKKQKRIQPVDFPKRIITTKAKRLATCVLTSILAKTKDNIFNHITGCPS